MSTFWLLNFARLQWLCFCFFRAQDLFTLQELKTAILSTEATKRDKSHDLSRQFDIRVLKYE